MLSAMERFCATSKLSGTIGLVFEVSSVAGLFAVQVEREEAHRAASEIIEILV